MMRKIVTLIVFSLTISISYAQKNDYFGSVIIPKNEYLVKVKGTNQYLSFPKNENATVLIKPLVNEVSNKVMFIPAGNGYYFIKFIQNGNYLNADKLGENTALNAKVPQRTDNQKFKIVSTGNGLFKFIMANNLAIDNSNKNTGIQLKSDNGSEGQKFEIIEAATKKTFTGN